MSLICTKSLGTTKQWKTANRHTTLRKQSCRAVIDNAFEELKVHKIFAETTDAVKSVGLMKKLGMQPEGIQRSQTKDNHGNLADLYLYGLPADDWREYYTGYRKLQATDTDESKVKHEKRE